MMKSNVSTPLNKLFTCKRPVFVIVLFIYYCIDFSKSFFFLTQPAHYDANWDVGDAQPH